MNQAELIGWATTLIRSLWTGVEDLQPYFFSAEVEWR